MDQVITFDKTFDMRLQEYTNILSINEVLPAARIKKDWSYYLELIIDYAGWQAVWKISRSTCELHKLSYPIIVLVYVEKVLVDELKAIVKILAVQDDILLPEIHNVPLIELWPTELQDQTVDLNMLATANAIDVLRFFFVHLWMPWDLEEDENIDWKNTHLEPRLRLYYDIKLGIIPRKTAEHIRSLLSEAKKIQTKREQLEEELNEEDNLIDLPALCEKGISFTCVKSLMDLHMRFSQIKNEFEILESPVLRNVLIRNLKELEETEKTNRKKDHWLIFQEELNANEYINYLEKVKSILPVETKFKTAISLINAIESANQNDVLVLSPGKHKILNTGAIEEGGSIIGLTNDNSETAIESINDAIMFDFSCNKVQLENLSFDVCKAQYGIVIRKGCVTLKNCYMKGTGNSSVHQGIIVLKEGKLILDNCKISDFNCGIVVNAGGEVIVKNSEISNLNIGLKFYDKSSVQLSSVEFSNCNEYGIYMETDSNSFEGKISDDLSILSRMKEIKMSACSFSNNKLGDAILYRKTKIIPINDLLSNPSYNNLLNYTSYSF